MYLGGRLNNYGDYYLNNDESNIYEYYIMYNTFSWDLIFKKTVIYEIDKAISNIEVTEFTEDTDINEVREMYYSLREEFISLSLELKRIIKLINDKYLLNERN